VAGTNLIIFQYVTNQRVRASISWIAPPIFLGSDAFVTSLQSNLNAEARLREIPAVQRRPLPKPLAQIAEEHERDEAILRAYASGGYSLQEIGDHFDLHYSRVSRIVKQRRLAKDKTWQVLAP
jgi:hypothetical protein